MRTVYFQISNRGYAVWLKYIIWNILIVLLIILSLFYQQRRPMETVSIEFCYDTDPDIRRRDIFS